MLVLLLAVLAAPPRETTNDSDSKPKPDFRKESPDDVTQYLDYMGLPGGKWKQYDGDGPFRSISKPFSIRESSATGVPSTIAYMLEGDERSVKKLELSLFMGDPAKKKDCLELMTKMASTLNKRATGEKIPAASLAAIKAGKSTKWNAGDVKVTAVSEPFKGELKGFELRIVWK